MRISTAIILSAGLALMPAVANAQWAPGAELAGQSVQVETAGVANTIYFDQGGTARIITPGGSVVPATWTSGPSGLCLNAMGGQECWSYSAPLSAGQSATMTSSCGAVSVWNAAGTNAPPPMYPQPVYPQPSPQGERG